MTTERPNGAGPRPAPDPLIDEIRNIRKAISEEFGNDVRRLGRHLQELQDKHPELLAKDPPVVRRPA